ncbi:MAG: outer membrane lipoprotein-sorting protein [Flavobacteriaceae bacterium]|nr:outer membrane lipoprotein-sorting protein [Flavobacteriaceae bacterium]
MNSISRIVLLFIFGSSLTLQGQSTSITADEILKKVDANMIADTQIVSSEMIVYGKRKSRTIKSKGYSRGSDKHFTEYLSPEREKGTKMLKLEDRLWIYSPATDRIIQLSGHLLRQSVMGSDLSYEDMMEERKLTDIYTASTLSIEELDNRQTYKMELLAKVEDVSYYKRILWIDTARFVPLKEELYAKSGKLLKKTSLSEVKQIQGRWYPTKINYKDMLKDGQGTDFIVNEIIFNPAIADRLFLKSTLKN